MSLVLGRKEGELFNVGPHRFRVVKIHSETQFRLAWVNGEEAGKEFDIDDQVNNEVAPGVRIMCGLRGQLNLARVSITADPDLRISRD